MECREWNLGSEELFVTYLHDNNKRKIIKIKNYLDFFISTSLNHMFIRSHLVCQLKNKLISNNEQLFNAMDLSRISTTKSMP